jgi:hypothetical protein
MLRRTGFLFSVALVLTGCVFPGTDGLPTLYPADYVPTAVYLTALSIDAQTQTANPPTSSPTVTSTPIPATPAPTGTPTPGPAVPLAAIQVRAPGAMSRVVSPLQVSLLAIAGESKRVEVALYGEDGRLLGRTLLAVAGSSGGDPISLKMPFEIRAAGETGFLQVSTRNGDGRLQSLITVPVLLLSSGESQINPPGNTIYERVALEDLPPEAEISGTELEVIGRILPYNSNPVLMELITEEGQNLSLRVLNLPGEDWQDVHTTLPFRVTSPTPARILVRQLDQVIDGDGYVFSQLLTLMP